MGSYTVYDSDSGHLSPETFRRSFAFPFAQKVILIALLNMAETFNLIVANVILPKMGHVGLIEFG